MIKRASFLLFSIFFVLGCSEDPPGPPIAPVGLTATAISNREIQLSWTDASNDEHGFVIQRLSGPDRLPTLFVGVIQLPVNASGYTDRSLVPGTNYSYRVSAFNSIGSNYSNVATATTIDQPIPLQVTTEIGSIGMASAFGVGFVNADAYPEVSAQGFVWSTEPSPTIELESKTTIESFNPPILEPDNINSWYSTIGALESSTNYHVRAYATNALGTVYGNEVTVTTSNEPFFRPGSGVMDVEGNSYKTVILGDQEWMAENLRTARYTNGEEIPNVISNGWSELKSPAWCHYDNDPQYDGLQGKMYNWFTLSDSRNLCPNGWHVPDLSEWSQLNEYLGGAYIAGVRLKSPLPSWEQPDFSTNESGFSAVHSGICQPCVGINSRAEWWSSSEVGPYPGKWGREAFAFSVSAGRGIMLTSTGLYSAAAALCVRCVKN